jgi:hypothetical protein
LWEIDQSILIPSSYIFSIRATTSYRSAAVT